MSNRVLVQGDGTEVTYRVHTQTHTTPPMLYVMTIKTGGSVEVSIDGFTDRQRKRVRGTRLF